MVLVVCQGVYDCLLITTLPDLRDRLKTTTDKVALARAFKEVGRLVGSVVGGVASDRFQQHATVFLGVSMAVAGASVMAEPWAHWLPVLGLLYCVEGAAQGAIDSGTTNTACTKPS